VQDFEHSRRCDVKLVRTRRSAVAAAVVLSFFVSAPLAQAEPAAGSVATAPSASSAASLGSARHAGLGDAMQRAVDLEIRRADMSLSASPPPSQQGAPPERKRGVGRVILGAATGAVAGFFAGAYLGAGLEPDCNCDDPGLRGVLIGAPLGAVAGGIVGGKWFFR
jgi:hypothetical protein